MRTKKDSSIASGYGDAIEIEGFKSANLFIEFASLNRPASAAVTPTNTGISASIDFDFSNDSFFSGSHEKILSSSIDSGEFRTHEIKNKYILASNFDEPSKQLDRGAGFALGLQRNLPAYKFMKINVTFHLVDAGNNGYYAFKVYPKVRLNREVLVDNNDTLNNKLGDK